MHIFLSGSGNHPDLTTYFKKDFDNQSYNLCASASSRPLR